MSTEQSPVQQPVLQQRVAELEQRVKLLEQRLQGTLSVEAVRASRFEIMDTHETVRAVLALRPDEKQVVLKFRSVAGKEILSIEERGDGGCEIRMTTGEANSLVAIKAVNNGSASQSGYEFVLMSPDGHFFMLPSSLKMTSGQFKDRAHLYASPSGVPELDFFNSQGKVVANIGGNDSQGGSVNVDGDNSFVNIRADDTMAQVMAYRKTDGSIIMRLKESKRPDFAINDENGNQRIRLAANEGFASIDMLSAGGEDKASALHLFSGIDLVSIVSTVGNKGDDYSLLATTEGAQMHLRHRGDNASIQLDTQSVVPSVLVGQDAEVSAVSPTEISFFEDGEVVAQLPQGPVDDGGDGGEQEGDTLRIPLGTHKMANQWRRCPNPVFGGKFHPLGDTRSHRIKVWCEVSHPEVNDFRDAVVDCAKTAAATAAIVTIAVNVATDGVTGAESLAVATTSFKAAFKTCLQAKGVEIANQLVPKIVTDDELGDWSGSH